MDCQEWKDKDLSGGYKQFSQDLDQVSTSCLCSCTGIHTHTHLVSHGSGYQVLCL